MKRFYKWLVPIFFILMGIFCFLAVHGHDFLGLICCGIAAVISCYYVIGLLRQHSIFATKVLSTILTSLLCLGIVAFALT